MRCDSSLPALFTGKFFLNETWTGGVLDRRFLTRTDSYSSQTSTRAPNSTTPFGGRQKYEVTSPALRVIQAKREPRHEERPSFARGKDRLPANEISRAHGIKTETGLLYAFQRGRHIGFLHKSEMDLCAPESFIQILHRDAIFGVGKIRNLFGSDGEQYDLLVQHFVMFEIMKQSERRSKSVPRHIDGGPWHASDTLAF